MARLQAIPAPEGLRLKRKARLARIVREIEETGE